MFSSLYAQSEAARQQPSWFESLLPIFVMFVAMYFILIRPQTKKAKEHAELLKSIKIGDEVVTSGGIIGRVRSVADEFVTVDTGGGSLKILKEHILKRILVDNKPA